MTESSSQASQRAWLDRYEQRMIAVGVPAAMAHDAARAVPFSELSEWYEDDPEGAADMEMSYWSDDCD